MRTALDVAIAKPQLASQPQVRALDASLREDLDQAGRLLEGFLVLARAQHRALGAGNLGVAHPGRRRRTRQPQRG